MYMIEPYLFYSLQPFKQFVQNIQDTYQQDQQHLWQIINVSKRELFHSFRGRMFDEYLEHYKILKSVTK